MSMTCQFLQAYSFNCCVMDLPAHSSASASLTASGKSSKPEMKIVRYSQRGIGSSRAIDLILRGGLNLARREVAVAHAERQHDHQHDGALEHPHQRAVEFQVVVPQEP